MTYCRPHHPLAYRTKYIVQKCFDEQIASCGDLLCEVSTDNVYEILIQVKENILACVEGEK